MTVRKIFLFLLACITLNGCSSARSTDHLKPVTGFDTRKYMGTWHELARFPHSFEKDLHDVTAHYSLRKNGSISVENRGVLPDGTVKISHGVAFPTGENTGSLRVSFFRPFYGDYKIILLEKDYSAAIVTSGTMDYLWILSRTKNISPEKKKAYTAFLRQCGFPIEKLMWQ